MSVNDRHAQIAGGKDPEQLASATVGSMSDDVAGPAADQPGSVMTETDDRVGVAEMLMISKIGQRQRDE